MSEERLNETDIINRYKAMQQECTSLFNKISELQVDRDEHALVINQLKPLDAGRKAFRLIGGVLVERTVAEVLPSVEQHLQGITQLTGQLEQQLKVKEEESKAWKEKYQIRTQSEVQAAQAAQGGNAAKPTSGVLA